MKLTKNHVFLHYFSKFMGILIFVLKYMYISLLLKMINGFSWPAKIMVSPFKPYHFFLQMRIHLSLEHYYILCIHYCLLEGVLFADQWSPSGQLCLSASMCVCLFVFISISRCLSFFLFVSSCPSVSFSPFPFSAYRFFSVFLHICLFFLLSFTLSLPICLFFFCLTVILACFSFCEFLVSL